MKSRNKNSFLLCFRPPEVYDDEREEIRSTGSSSSRGSEISEDDSKVIRRRKRLASHVLANIFRSAFFVTSLQKSRVGKNRKIQPQYPKPVLPQRVSHVSNGKSERDTCRKSTDRDDPKSDTDVSSPSPSPSSCSSSSSPRVPEGPEPTLWRKRSLPPTPKMPTPFPTIYSSATGLCLLVLSLSIMLFCGRLCAILWTSTWLCFLPRRGSEVAPASGDVAAAKEELPVAWSRELEVYNKKKVVLEGFLQRNRRV